MWEDLEEERRGKGEKTKKMGGRLFLGNERMRGEKMREKNERAN